MKKILAVVVVAAMFVAGFISPASAGSIPSASGGAIPEGGQGGMALPSIWAGKNGDDGGCVVQKPRQRVKGFPIKAEPGQISSNDVISISNLPSKSEQMKALNSLYKENRSEIKNLRDDTDSPVSKETKKEESSALRGQVKQIKSWIKTGDFPIVTMNPRLPKPRIIDDGGLLD